MLKNYLLIAYKVLLRRKFFTFISLAGISLTLMILIVYTAFMENMLGTMPPESKGDRILGAYRIEFSSTQMGPRSIGGPGYQFLNEYINIRTLPHIQYASILSRPVPVEGVYNGRMFKLFRKWTDGDYWNILDFNFIEGGPFTPADNESGRFVAVINRSVRKKMFGRGEALGQTITVDGQDFRVVGVVDDVPLYREVPFSEVWIPINTTKSSAFMTDGHNGIFYGIVLAENQQMIPAIREEYRKRVSDMDYPPPPYNMDVAKGDIMTYFEHMFAGQLLGRDANDPPLSKWGQSSYVFAFLTVPVLLFMLLPVLNLVNINLSRIIERSSEIGVRKAFGASAGYLVGQFLTENIILTVLGGLLGLVLSLVVLKIYASLQLIPYGQLRFNGWIFFYGFVITIVFGLLSGVYPAWKMSRMHPVDALRKSPL